MRGAVMADKQPDKIILAVTGATGMLFVREFLAVVATTGITIHGICSDSGKKVLNMELGLAPEELPGVSRWFSQDDFAAPPASGSAGYRSMVVLPCTMGTLGAIASGLSINLIHRAADVILKERGTLVLAARETPFNRNHLQNMLVAHDAGAVICPPMPSYYLKPTTLEEAARMYGWRLADQLGIEIGERKRWGDTTVC